MSTSITKTIDYKYITIILLVLLTVLIRLPVLLEPWGGDQAGFGYVAKEMLDGKVPYKDMYSLTAYGVFFTFALFMKLFGTTMVSAHIGHILTSVITVILVYLLTHRLYGKKAAIIAGLCYTIFSNGLAFSGFGYENKSAWGTYWYLSQREVFMAPLILGAVFLEIIGNEKYWFFVYLLCGIFIGLAAFYKLTAALILLLFMAYIPVKEFLNHTKFNYKKVIGENLCLILGFVLIQLPFIYYFWIHKALHDVYQSLFVHLSLYAGLSRGLRIETFFSGHFSILRENFVLWLFALISCFHILFKDRSKNNIFIVLWGFCSLLMVWGQGKFFGYHFIILVPPFAVLTGYGLTIFLENGPGLKGFLLNNLQDIRKTFILVTIVVTIIGFGISNYDYYRRHVRYFMGKISKQDYYNVFDEFPTHPYSFRSDYQIVRYLRENSKPEDKLGVIFSAGDTIIHFLSGLEPATRFIQSWYLFPSDEALAKNEITINLRKEFIAKLIHVAPRFILSVHIPLEKLSELPFVKDDPNFKKLKEFIEKNYRAKDFPDNRILFQKIS
jgi:hypothetical protein